MTITDPISAATHYRNVLRSITHADTKHSAIAQAAAALDVTFEKPSADQQITVASGYGGNTHRPFVTVTMTERVMQLDSATARQIALQVLEAADAAESDGFLMEWLQESERLTPTQLGGLLRDFRQYRNRIRVELAHNEEPRRSDE